MSRNSTSKRSGISVVANSACIDARELLKSSSSATRAIKVRDTSECKYVSNHVPASYRGSSLGAGCDSECELGFEKGKLNVKTKGKAADRMSTGLAVGAAAAGIGGGIAIAIGVYHRHQSSMRG